MVKLSVHKNTVEKRRKKSVAKGLVQHTSRIVKDYDIRAYAVTMIDSEGEAHCIYDSGSIMPMWCFAETMGAIVKSKMETEPQEETWKPPLNIKG